MNAAIDQTYSLKDRYERREGRIFLTGIQALARLPMMQRQLDIKNGLDTAGFISGYRGSPLGAYDQELWRSKKMLAAHDVHFEPGINEDLGATAVWGTQLIDYYRDEAKKDGVFAYWYGKAHGVDRSADVFRQANVQGTARHGGVLAFCGDDHAAESSMFSHQTDQIFEAAIMPILFPANVEEYLSMGLMGIAMSRFSGLWVGFKTISETVESAASIIVPTLPELIIPKDVFIPPHGLNYDIRLQWPAERMEYERRMIEERVPAAHAFVYANKIDRIIFAAPEKRLGIVTVGKAHGDLMEALSILGLDEKRLAAAGISVFKVGMSWPLEPRGIREFAEDMQSLFVVEEKRPQLEKQIKEQLYNWPADKRPEILGKRDRQGAVLLPEIWVFTPEIVAGALARWLEPTELGSSAANKVAALKAPNTNTSKALVARSPYFCSGCPHNTSTKVPEGSIAGAGIGCHIMVLGQGRKTETFTHMGGEGIHWVGLHRFSKTKHMFQNLGDGTYQHSGLLAVRQAVVSGVNITYKILFNDAVAMVGGQPVEGQPSPGMIAQQLLAEGVKHVALVSDDISKYNYDKSVPVAVARHGRDDLDSVQKQLRDIPGVTAIIYEQTCAAEKRRRRKKGILPDPDRRLFIHDRVCEGCGDCSVQSNCISIEPKETLYGRKRQINQSSCNKDYSCVKGFCPSFVSVVGGHMRKPDTSRIEGTEAALMKALPDVTTAPLSGVYSILIAGIGGTGVLTIGAILTMAAHLESKGATALDFTGLSQKNGAVTAHIKIAPSPADIHVTRIVDGGANLMLACDMVAAAPSVAKMKRGVTKSLVNTAEVPVAAFTRQNNMTFPARETREEFILATRAEDVTFVDATALALKLFGDTIAANLFMVGYAWQQGFIPLSKSALLRAVELNGVAVDFNKRAFQWGRLAAHDGTAIDRLVAADTTLPEPTSLPLEDLIARHHADLVQYQNQAYADSYRGFILDMRRTATERLGAQGDDLILAAAKYLYKLMAYKDEYEIGRLYSDPAFKEKLAAQFDGDYKLQFHLAPPLLARMNKATGRPDKMTFGAWMLPAFRMLAGLKGLRGTVFDVFGYSAERRQERRLITDYKKTVAKALAAATSDNLAVVQELLALPEMIRGYGPVKEASVEQAAEKQALLLHKLNHPAAAPKAA